LLKTSNVSSLATLAKGEAGKHRIGCQNYARRLRDRLAGMNISSAPRLKTAQATLSLVERLFTAENDGVVGVLASAEVATSEAAMSTCLVDAAELSATLEAFNWEILDAVSRLTDERQAGAAEVNRLVREALAADEHAVPLGPALKEAQSKAVRLLTQKAPRRHRLLSTDRASARNSESRRPPDPSSGTEDRLEPGGCSPTAGAA